MSNSKTIALTGATGFIGRFLLKDLKNRGYNVRALIRRPGALIPEIESAVVGDLSLPNNLAQALRGVDFVVHSAATAPSCRADLMTTIDLSTWRAQGRSHEQQQKQG